MVVSAATILMMAISAVISIGLPVALLIIWHKKTGAKWTAAIVGAILFVLFVFGLENGLHQIMIFNDTGASRFLKTNLWAYILYAGLAAGVFEETARLIAFKWLLKKQTDRSTGVMYGIGHGGIEAILIAGVSMISSISFALTLNALGESAVLAKYVGQETAIAATIAALKQQSAGLYLVTGIERAIAIVLHISLSVMVFFAARRSGKMWLYPAAIGVHAAVDCFAVLYQVGILTNIVLIEAGVLVMTLATAYWAYRIYREDCAEGDAATVSQTPAAEPAPAQEAAPEKAE